MFHCSRFEKQRGWRWAGLEARGERQGAGQGGRRHPPDMRHKHSGTRTHARMRTRARGRESGVAFIHMSAHERGEGRGRTRQGELGRRAVCVWVCVCVGASVENFVSSLFTHHQDSAAYVKSMGSTMETLKERHGFAACSIADDNCGAVCLRINMYLYVHTYACTFTYIHTQMQNIFLRGFLCKTFVQHHLGASAQKAAISSSYLGKVNCPVLNIV